jgi:hypothetical protein
MDAAAVTMMMIYDRRSKPPWTMNEGMGRMLPSIRAVAKYNFA